MRVPAIRRFMKVSFALGALICAAARAGGSSIAVDVVDKDGRPVPQIAIYAIPKEGWSAEGTRSTAIMDQQHGAFVPHILVASTGSEIHFPNNDAVSHHVYSFSPAKSFELALYKQGTVHAPLTFDKPGVVTLGCNIHDDMVGYILIVDTPHFAMTDGDGTATLDGLPPGSYSIQTWTPRMRPADLPAPIEVSVAAEQAQRRAVQFVAKLHPAHDSSETSLPWSRY